MKDVNNDEVSLVDLWFILQMHKRVVFNVTLFCLMIGAAYAFLAKPIYRAEAFMLPPSGKGIQALNVEIVDNQQSKLDGTSGISMISEYSVEAVYDAFIQELQSRENQKAFYEKHGVAEKLNLDVNKENAVRVFEESFVSQLHVLRNVKKKELAGFTSLSLDVPDAALSADWVNQFVRKTAANVSIRLVGDVMSKIKSRKDMLSDSIQSKLQMAKQRREDRLTALKEAVVIAGALQEKASLESFVRAGVALNTDNLPLYMLGVPALKAEINMLETRKDDAPFIKGLRDLQEQLLRLEKIEISPSDVHVMALDQEAFVPEKPIKPKKGLVLVLAMFIGLVLGIAAAFARHAIQEKKV